MNKLLLTLVITLLLSFSASAKYKQTCVARYMTEDGWSKKYTVNVTFISGAELNEATSSFNYSSFSVYAVIFWGEGQASVIKLTTYLACGDVVDENCISNTIGDLKGKDQEDSEWKICISDFCY